LSSLFHTQPLKATTLPPFRLKVEHSFEQNSSLSLAQRHFKDNGNMHDFRSRNEEKINQIVPKKQFSEKSSSNSP
jgi:hypothetical protein